MVHGPRPRRTGIDPPALVAAGALSALRPGDRPLVIEEPTQVLADALEAQGVTPHVWLRRLGRLLTARPWPLPGPYTSAFVRLPKAKDALDLALHAAASVLPAGAPIVLYGANDEGIRSADAHLKVVADAVATVDRRRHCRVLAGARCATIAGLKGTLSEWRTTLQAEIGGEVRRWVSFPGLFAGGGLDEGTALLLAHLPDVAADASILDFGCGTGIIGAGLLRRRPEARLALMDADAIALEAARENVPGARLLLGNRLSDAGASRYHAIFSNPPIHEGVSEHHGTLEHLIDEAPRHLRTGGILQIVVQRRVRAAERMQAIFGNVAVAAQNGRYRVLLSRKAE